MVSLRFDYSSNSVPVLYDAQIDGHVVQLLTEYRQGEMLSKPMPLNIEDFAENYLGLKFHFANLSHNGFIYGRMVFNNTKIIIFDPAQNRAEEDPVQSGTIVIDNSIAEGHELVFRSTVAHECGHDIYHAEYFVVDPSELCNSSRDVERMPYTLCKARDIVCGDDERKKLITPHDWIEHHAKYFSAALLMPKPMMEQLCRDKKTRQYCFDNHHGFENDALIEIIMQTFQVSAASARIRLKSLKLAYVSQSESPLSYYRTGRQFNLYNQKHTS
jgi:Zn-dependent peptidase ImmA (M78 family)